MMQYFDSASLILTENCNLNCSYCYEKCDNIKDLDMTFNMAKKAINFLIKGAQLNKTNKISITYFGGEPTLNVKVLNESFDYALEACKEAHLEFNPMIVTNCTVFPEGYEEFLTKWKRAIGRINVQLSVDGMPEVQDLCRVKHDNTGSSDLVETTIRKYLKFAGENDVSLGEEIHIHSVISKDSLPKLYENYEYFRSFGFPGFWYMPVHEELWTEEDVEKYKEQLSLIVEKAYNDCVNSGDIKYYKSLSSLSKCYGQFPEKPCGAGYNFCTINGKGEIYVCHRTYFSELREETFLGTLNDSYDSINSKRDIYLDYNSDNLIGDMSCSNCDNTECYRCIAANHKANGNMFLGFPQYCTMSHAEKKIRRGLQTRLYDAGMIKDKPVGYETVKTVSETELAEYIDLFNESVKELLEPTDKLISAIIEDTKTNRQEIIDIHERLNQVNDSINSLTAVVMELTKFLVQEKIDKGAK